MVIPIFRGNPGLLLDVDVVSLFVFRRDLKFFEVLSAKYVLSPAIIIFMVSRLPSASDVLSKYLQSAWGNH